MCVCVCVCVCVSMCVCECVCVWCAVCVYVVCVGCFSPMLKVFVLFRRLCIYTCTCVFLGICPECVVSLTILYSVLLVSMHMYVHGFVCIVCLGCLSFPHTFT